MKNAKKKRVTIVMSEDLYNALAYNAWTERLSVSAYIRKIISTENEKRKKK